MNIPGRVQGSLPGFREDGKIFYSVQSRRPFPSFTFDPRASALMRSEARAAFG
jgi:hypothetical protein